MDRRWRMVEVYRQCLGIGNLYDPGARGMQWTRRYLPLQRRWCGGNLRAYGSKYRWMAELADGFYQYQSEFRAACDPALYGLRGRQWNGWELQLVCRDPARTAVRWNAMDAAGHGAG